MPIVLHNDVSLTHAQIMELARLLTDDELEQCKRVRSRRTVHTPEKLISLKDAITMYVDKCLPPNNEAKAQTAISYNITFRQFSDSIFGEFGFDPLVHEIAHEHIDNFIRSLEGRNGRLTPNTQARKLATLQSLFTLLVKKGYLIESPCQDVETDRIPELLPVALTVPEAKKMLQLAGTITRHPQRDKAIIGTFLLTGCRLSELVGLSVGDWNIKKNSIQFFGKGSKEREVPVLPPLYSMLMDYLISSGLKYKTRERLFPMCKENVQRIVKNLFEKMGYDVHDKRSVHSLRHTFAVLCLMHGVNIEALRKLMGYDRLSTTKHYTRIDVEQLREILNTKLKIVWSEFDE